jgi:hypothetical protein
MFDSAQIKCRAYPSIEDSVEDDKAVEKMLKREKADQGVPLIGIFPGAGHGRRYDPIDRFQNSLIGS